MGTQHRFALVVCLLAVLSVTAGCVSSSSSRVTVQEATRISKGQELNDLLRARDAGAMTDSEYQTVRKVIMDRPN